MGANSKIQWTEHTWNPWQGCIKVSPGCKFCYMYRHFDRWGKDGKDVHLSKPPTFNAPIKWNKQGPAFVFTCSLSDFFLEQADPWRAQAWEIIKNTPNLTYQILTKRPERILRCLPADWEGGYPNVWIGVSAEDEAEFSKRVVQLTMIPAKIRFISIEPLLSSLNLHSLLTNACLPHHEVADLIQWIIVGGESGNDNGKFKYRPCEVSWLRTIVDDCLLHDIPVFVKQLGSHIAEKYSLKDRFGGKSEEWKHPDLIPLNKCEMP